MSQSSVPRALSWTSLVALTLIAALAETTILFPSVLFPGTRLATALSWDASNPGYPLAGPRHPRHPAAGDPGRGDLRDPGAGPTEPGGAARGPGLAGSGPRRAA